MKELKLNNKIIKQLVSAYEEIALLGEISSLLGWDLNVNLPAQAANARSEQTAYITKVITDKWHDKSFRSLLEKANELEKASLTLEEQAIVRNLNYAAKIYYRVSPELIIEKEKVTSEAFLVWKDAKEKNNYKLYLPYLKKIVELNRRIAERLIYKDSPYDALLDLHEPELTAADARVLFQKVKPEIISLVKKIRKSKNYSDSHPAVKGKLQYPLTDQERIARYVMQKMGYDFTAGRMDVSPHPFTIQLGQHDVRITNMYNLYDFRESFTSTMHETGHALYEQGITTAYNKTPIAGGVSYGIHEAISRFWENMVGRNTHFLRYLLPVFQGTYQEQLANCSEETIVSLFNIVKPSFIRIEADEVTYSLHIILRFEIEHDILSEKISVEDAPEVWKTRSRDYFGIAPDTDSEGILQDVHWAYGALGYFPSYALGNLYGAQMLHSMKKDVQVNTDLAQGNLSGIQSWLQKHIYQYGSLYMPQELIQKATGESLNPQYFIDYLKEKYSEIYSLV